MPKAVLPHNLKGWTIALAASFVGFVSGFATIRLAEKLWR